MAVIAPLTNVPLSADGRFCIWHYRRASALDITDEEEIQRQLAQGVVQMEEITQTIQETGKDAMAYQLRTIEEAFENLKP